MPRTLKFVLLIAAGLVIGTCSQSQGVLPKNDCANGLGNDRREKPVICVDNTGAELSVHPKRAWVWDAVEADKTRNMLHWVTRTRSGDLQLRFNQAGCVETPVCDGRGRCKAKTIPVTDPKEVRRCKYDVIVDGRVLDPDVVIVKCCSNQDPDNPQ